MKISSINTLCFTACALLGSQFAAAADRISYDYAGAQFVDVNYDDADCDADGISVYGSKSLNNEFFVLGGLADLGGDWCDSTNLNLGLGYQTLFGADSSIYGALSFERLDFDDGDDDTGMILAVGIRGFVAPQLEGKLEVAHHTVFDGDTQLNGGAYYWFNPSLAATAEVSLGSEATSIGVGVRFNF
jgi:hypothetical protein